MALTPAERQARRRAKLAAERASLDPTGKPHWDSRETHQEAWDNACNELEHQLELYRIHCAQNAVQGTALRAADLPRLATLVLSLSLIEFPPYFGDEIYVSGLELPGASVTGLDPRSLRERLFAIDPWPEPSRFARNAEDDASAQDWWSRIPPDARQSWLDIARSDDPYDVWYMFIRKLA